jgi:hypothetical protein
MKTMRPQLRCFMPGDMLGTGELRISTLTSKNESLRDIEAIADPATRHHLRQSADRLRAAG